jgi:hypothetical protein
MTMSRIDQKTYQTFEEFEREELRRETSLESGYEILSEMFAGELDFEPSSSRRSARDDAQSDDEE